MRRSNCPSSNLFTSDTHMSLTLLLEALSRRSSGRRRSIRRNRRMKRRRKRRKKKRRKKRGRRGVIHAVMTLSSLASETLTCSRYIILF